MSTQFRQRGLIFMLLSLIVIVALGLSNLINIYNATFIVLFLVGAIYLVSAEFDTITNLEFRTFKTYLTGLGYKFRGSVKVRHLIGNNIVRLGKTRYYLEFHGQTTEFESQGEVLTFALSINYQHIHQDNGDTDYVLAWDEPSKKFALFEYIGR